MQKIFKTIVFFFFFSTTIYGQRYLVKFLDISQGLSNNSVTTIYQDKTGYIWFGTYDGLNRYDGYEFKVFRNTIHDDSSLSANFIFCIDGDSKGNIWVGTSNGGSIIDIRTRNITQLSINSSNNLLRDENVTRIKQFGNSMLVGCEKSGLLVFDELTNVGQQIPLYKKGKRVKNYQVTGIEPVSSKGFSWVFIKDYGLYKYWSVSKKLENITTSKVRANVLKQDDKGVLWVGTDDGLFPFYENKKQYGGNLLSTKAIVINLLIDKKKEIYVATDGAGVFKINKQNKAIAFEGDNKQSLLKSNAVWGLYEDKDQNKWIATLRGGVSMIASSERYFNHVKTGGNNPALNYILSFCEDSDKKIWIGTDGAGLRFWNRATNTFEKFNTDKQINSAFVPGIVSDFQANLWVATWDGGLIKINTKNHKVQYYTLLNTFTKQQENNIWLVFKDSNNTIWATTKEGTLFYYDKNEDTFKVFHPHLSGILTLTESQDGKLWAGTYSELIQIDPKTRKFKRNKIGNPIRCILEDSKSNLWLGTSEGGLLYFDAKTRKSERFTTTNGLPSNIVLRILEDKKGYLWLSTYNGLSRFDPEKKVFRNFTVSDGLQSNQFSYNAGITLSTGEFLFGGINGFNVFYPEKIKDVTTKSSVLLDDIQVNNELVVGKSEYFDSNHKSVRVMEVPFDQTTISLDFVAINFANADKIDYAYFLDGWDEHWNYIGKDRKARYSKLREGIYEFKVKTTNNYKQWEPEKTLLVIRVLPPWYRTWWAYLLYMFSVSGILALYIRYTNDKQRLKYEVKLAHMESLKEKEFSEKQISMFTYISHEFRTPLSLIINPLKKVIKKQNKSGEPIPELAVAHRNARRLLSLIDQLLLFRRADSDADQLSLAVIDLNKLCDEVYQCFTQQAKTKKIDYNIDLPSEPIMIIADYEKIEISLFNLVSNAFKFTPEKGAIALSLSQTNREAIIKIKDTGIGIENQELDYIYDKFRQVNLKTSPGKGFGIGLFIVKYFMEKHFGQVECESQLGKGTEFTLKLKKGDTHFEGLPIHNENVKMSKIVKELNAENLYNEVEHVAVNENDTLIEKLSVDVVSDKKSIIIIDDNDEIREYLVQLFAENYITYSANNGIDGYKMINKILPDIVLSDISMEGMNGIELCKIVKGTPATSHILVILLTAATSSEIQLQGITEGADDYLTKPFDDEILKAKVETLLRNRGQLKKYYLESITLSPNAQKVPVEYRDFLNECITVIERNLGNQKFSIREFSKEMGMSHTKLYSKIKEISGQTLNGFIRSVRLRRAAVLLLTEDILISHAASQVGMEDIKYFREQFVKLYGMNPSDFIKKYRNSFNSELNVIQNL
ncbi:hybrid sensor histidine kinase/response regulator transcription factor [Flavobacterium adhaerens]|uniref:hybrid sensor histidine kinase/response regulator transcription factor n=1 Tax=Flavobacterium adhaerens TaxID=3149043 RepID=UPI0032B5BF2F